MDDGERRERGLGKRARCVDGEVCRSDGRILLRFIGWFSGTREGRECCSC